MDVTRWPPTMPLDLTTSNTKVSQKFGVQLGKNLGPTWGQNQGLLGPKPWSSGGKDNELNRTFGRGGGDRIYQGAESKGTLRNVL